MYKRQGEDFTAADAHRTGLIQEVVADGKQLERAIEIAELIAKQAPLGVYATLRSARLSVSHGEQTAIKDLMTDLPAVMQSEDAKEGVNSFIERREAAFKGK